MVLHKSVEEDNSTTTTMDASVPVQFLLPSYFQEAVQAITSFTVSKTAELWSHFQTMRIHSLEQRTYMC